MSCSIPRVANEYLETLDRRRMYQLHVGKMMEMKSAVDMSSPVVPVRFVCHKKRKDEELKRILKAESQNTALIRNYNETRNQQRNRPTTRATPWRNDWIKDLNQQKTKLTPMTCATPKNTQFLSKPESQVFSDEGFTVVDPDAPEMKICKTPSRNTPPRTPKTPNSIKIPSKTQHTKPKQEQCKPTGKLPDLQPVSVKEESPFETTPEKLQDEDGTFIISTHEEVTEENEITIEKGEETNFDISNTIKDTLMQEKTPNDIANEQSQENDQEESNMGLGMRSAIKNVISNQEDIIYSDDTKDDN